MKLYFSPLACSAASRIALYEVGDRAEVEFIEVDPKTKLTEDGGDFLAVHALGLVPLLETDDGERFSENAAVLQYIADSFPDAELAPRGTLGRTRLQQWLSFIGTELHKASYFPLLDEQATEAARSYALSKVEQRFGWLAAQLGDREFLLDRFSVADAYLATILNWSLVTPIELAAWPALEAYHKRLSSRPSAARAFNEERVLYVRELQRHGSVPPNISKALGMSA